MPVNQLSAVLESMLSRRMFLGTTAGVALAAATTRLPGAFAHQEADFGELVIVGTDFAFDLPATVESGMTRVTLDNQGAMDHHAILLKLNDGVTPDDINAALQDPAFVELFKVSSSLGGPMAGPGLSASVVLDLLPGNYIAICAVPNEEGIPHFALGMIASFEVTDSGATAAAPEAALTVELMEMMFHGLEETAPAAGPQAWEVVNAGGALHELVLLQLAPGFTFDQFLAMMTAPPASPAADESTPMEGMEMAAPPFTMVGGVAPMSPGFTNYAEFDLVAGEYALVCFVPDPATGAPHFALGMVSGFTVA